jgi:hypothetical protein
VPCQLVPGCVTPPIWFLSISPRVCSTLPSDPVSRRRPCAALSLRLHPAGKSTFTPKLCNMLGTHAGHQARLYAVACMPWLDVAVEACARNARLFIRTTS